MRTWSNVSVFGLRPTVFFAFALAACSGKDGTHGGNDDKTPSDNGGDADTDADADSDSDTDCDASIVTVDPLDGAKGVDPSSTVTVGFDVAIDAAQAWSIDIVDAPGSATLAADGLSATWSGTLDPDTQYTVNATVCSDEWTSSFKTSPLPVDLPSLVGSSFALDWKNQVTLTEPGKPDVLKALINIDYVLAQISAVDEPSESATALATVGDDDGSGNALPACGLVTVQTADFSQNPFFSITGNLTVTVNESTGATATIEDFSLLGLMASDGQSITDIQLSGLAATEQFLTNADCNSAAVQILQPTCQACTTSATGQCMLITGTAPIAPIQPALDIQTTCAGYYTP